MVSRLMGFEEMCEIFGVDPDMTESLLVTCQPGKAAMVTQVKAVKALDPDKKVASFYLIEADDE